MKGRLVLPLLVFAAASLAGCHLIFKYEDTPTDGAVPDRSVRKDGKPRDLPTAKRDLPTVKKDNWVLDGKVTKDFKKVPDKKVGKDVKKTPDKEMVPDIKIASDLKILPDSKVAKDISSTYTWKQISSGTTNDLRDVWGNSSSDVRAVGKGGATVRYSGKYWKKYTIYSFIDYRGTWGTGTTFHYVGEHTFNKAEVWATEVPGKWNNKSATGTNLKLNAVHGSSATNIYAVGEQNLIYKLSGTASWTKVTFTATFGQVNYTDLYAAPAGVTVLVTDDGIVVKLVNGAYKAHKAIAGKPELTSIWPRPGGDMFVTSEEGQIYRINETSLAVQSAFNNPNVEWRGLRGNSKGKLYAVGHSAPDGRYLPYQNGKWGPLQTVSGSSSDPKNFEAVWVADDNQVFMVGDKGLIYHYGP